MDAVTEVPAPRNEPVRLYAPGSAERAGVESALRSLSSDERELTQVIGGRASMGGGDEMAVVQPHDRHSVLGRLRDSSSEDAGRAIATGLRFRPLADTARDTLAWARSGEAAGEKFGVQQAPAGLDGARERELLEGLRSARVPPR